MSIRSEIRNHITEQRELEGVSVHVTNDIVDVVSFLTITAGLLDNPGEEGLPNGFDNPVVVLATIMAQIVDGSYLDLVSSYEAFRELDTPKHGCGG